MKWSFTVARIAGTRVRIHLTFFLLLAWIAIEYWRTLGPEAAVEGVLFIALVFGCVILHEFGHVFAALRYGITTPTVTLYPFGGMAAMTRIPTKPFQELVVAMAGPAVNFAIAGILLAFNLGWPAWNPELHLPGGGGLVERLIWINLILGTFNLIPAFPMDGGRVFRALLGFVVPRPRATAIAAVTGQVIALAFGFLALNLHEPILLLISLFVFFAAGSEKALVQTEHMLEGVEASQVSMKEFHTLKMDDTIHHAVDLILNMSQADFPVVNEAGQCVAIATRDAIISTLRQSGPEARISDAVQAIPEQIKGTTPATEAWQALLQSKLPAAAVVDERGRLTSWLTTENLSEFILTRTAMRDYVQH